MLHTVTTSWNASTPTDENSLSAFLRNNLLASCNDPELRIDKFCHTLAIRIAQIVSRCLFTPSQEYLFQVTAEIVNSDLDNNLQEIRFGIAPKFTDSEWVAKHEDLPLASLDLSVQLEIHGRRIETWSYIIYIESMTTANCARRLGMMTILNTCALLFYAIFSETRGKMIDTFLRAIAASNGSKHIFAQMFQDLPFQKIRSPEKNDQNENMLFFNQKKKLSRQEIEKIYAMCATRLRDWFLHNDEYFKEPFYVQVQNLRQENQALRQQLQNANTKIVVLQRQQQQNQKQWKQIQNEAEDTRSLKKSSGT